MYDDMKLTLLLLFNFTLSYSQIVSVAYDANKVELFYKKGNSIQSTVSENNLVFAMNGGMYYEDYSPMGLFVQRGKVVKQMNNRKASTNFYTSPGVFYIKDGRGYVCSRENYPGGAYYATQSGPILLTDGKINPKFSKTGNTNIRNGVGILPDGRVVFAISKGAVSFYELSEYFKDLGCTDAIFMDGCISSMYWNGEMVQYDGNYGVIIGVRK
jgi:uncharacterized protein YigE (DUF2233 family)